jgi:sugar transferase (PEP-CTERM/EpsH1 system associated)
MPLRIMHVVDSLGRGGLENGLVNLIDRMDGSRFEHIVVTMRGLGPMADRLRSKQVQIACLDKPTSSSVQLAALTRTIRKFQPDIVHSRNWAAIEAVLAGRWVKSRAVVHSEHGLDSNATVAEPWRRACFRRLAFELADRVLTVSHQLREFHARRTRFPERKITVIHNGVDQRRFFSDQGKRRRVRAECGLSEDEFCIGSVGSLFPIKDHATLLKAIGQMAEHVRNWHLLLIGEGPLLPKLQGFVNANPGWSARVTFLGQSNRVPELLNAMDVYVLPSISEGISNSLLEAMASGLPVVVTAAGGNPEVVVDGESGLLFPVGDFEKLAEQLRVLEARRDLRLQLGGAGLQRVRDEFSIAAMIRKYEQLYEGLVPALAAPVQAVVGA